MEYSIKDGVSFNSDGKVTSGGRNRFIGIPILMYLLCFIGEVSFEEAISFYGVQFFCPVRSAVENPLV